MPSDAVVDYRIHEMPIQPVHYLPLLNYQRKVLRTDVKIGEPVKRGQALAPGIVSPSSGVITDQINHPWPHPSNTEVPTLVLETDGLDNAIPNSDLTTDSLSDALTRIEQLAVHGLGGAGFSTANKITQAMAKGTPTLIINAVECEPGICCDDALMQQEPATVVKACIAVCDFLKLPSAVVAIEDDKFEAITALQNALDQHDHSLQLMKLPPIYPSGAENILIESVTGMRPMNGQHAAELGILCLNVASVVALHQALHGMPALDRIVTVSSTDLMSAINLRVRFGTPIDSVVQYAATLNADLATALQQNPSSVFVGGPVSGFSSPIKKTPVLATTNALQLGPAIQSDSPSACIRCGECSTVCPVQLLPQELYAAAAANDQQTAARYQLDSCILCGCCDLVCPASIPLTPWFRYAKDAARLRKNEELKADTSRAQTEARDQRLKRLEEERIAKAAARREASTKPDAKNDIKAALNRIKSKRKNP